jgi:hypothetical protein
MARLLMTIQKGRMEQRKHERVASTLQVSYRVLEADDAGQVLDHPHYNQTKTEHLPELSRKFHVYHAVTKDISEGGLSLMEDQPFAPGTHVEIFLKLPQFNRPITLLAEVVRAGSFLETGVTMYNAGVKLLAINREDMTHLNNYLLEQKLRQGSTGK